MKLIHMIKKEKADIKIQECNMFINLKHLQVTQNLQRNEING